MIDAKLAVIEQHIKEQPEISVTYFQPDEKKARRPLYDGLR